MNVRRKTAEITPVFGNGKARGAAAGAGGAALASAGGAGLEAAPTAPMGVPDKLILAIVAGMDAERVCRKLGIAEADIPGLLTEARRRLQIAADFNRDVELGTAITRLHDLYRQASGAKDRDGGPAPDVRTCMAVQKEINRLLDLYRPTVRHVEAGGEADAELAEIRGHLEPLGLAGDDAPTAELARLAVSEIVTLRQAAGREPVGA